jgi:hypothetical protein
MNPLPQIASSWRSRLTSQRPAARPTAAGSIMRRSSKISPMSRKVIGFTR